MQPTTRLAETTKEEAEVAETAVRQSAATTDASEETPNSEVLAIARRLNRDHHELWKKLAT